MPAKDTSEIRNKILSTLRSRGPSLPVHIAKATELSMLFASAFLSELLSEKKIKISNMKVGSSPIYFLPGQEHSLENFSQYLTSKEKEAFILLKEKNILEDKNQEPAIRIALRAIKDFAIPFKTNEKIFWRYFKVPATELKIEKEIIKEPEAKPINPPQIISQDIQKNIDKPLKEIPEENKEIKKQTKPKEEQKLNIFDNPKPIIKKKKQKKKTAKKKQDNKFFNKVKGFLLEKNIEILDIESFNKTDLILRIKDKDKEQLLIAYNKKRINEADIIKAHKRALESNLNYILLSLGEPFKKLSNLIGALRDLERIEKITEAPKEE